MEANGCLEIINLTGRDLLLHPKFFEIVELLRDCDVKKVIVETDCLTGFDDFDFMNKLKECKVQIAYMKNTPNPPKNTAVNRTELAVKKGESLDRLDTLKIPTDIILLHIKGINDEEISCLVQEYMKKDFVRNIVIQNQLNNGCDNLPSYSQVPCTIDEIEEILARGNMISQKDFMSPAHCHPLCSSVAYYIVHNQHTVALSQILHKNDIKGIFEQCCTSNSDKDLSRRVRDGLNRFWSDQDNPSAINVLREFVNKIYLSNKKISDKKKWENAEKMTKGVYIHQYMVASNFDIDRVSRCGDVFIDHSNRIMPVCSHHLIHH